jgi:hypothetical protein
MRLPRLRPKHRQTRLQTDFTMQTLQFLAGQFFTILGSVVGVYLAGYVTFRRTLEHDRLVKAQQKSNLLTAVREELKQNVVRMQKFNERLAADVGNPVGVSEWPRLRLFVWRGAGSAALDIPPQILADLQALYGDLEQMLSDAEARQNFYHLTQSNVYYRTQFKQQLTAQLKFAETSIVAALNNAIAGSERLTKKYSSK